MTLDEIKRLRKALEKATPGEWRTRDGSNTGHVWGPECEVLQVGDYSDKEVRAFNKERWNADKNLIVAARNALPALLDLAEEGLRVREHREDEDELVDRIGNAICLEFDRLVQKNGVWSGHELALAVMGVLALEQTPPSHGEVEAGKADLFGAFADTVKERDGDGFWRACSGCHETNEGCSTGSYPTSTVLGCEIGSGCSECGGIGVVWTQMNERDFAAWARASLSEPSGNAGAVGLEAPAPAWPAGCWEAYACSQYRRCMYMRSPRCAHEGQDLGPAIDAALEATLPPVPDDLLWLPHTPGDPQPVADDVIVDLKRADGEVVTGDAAWTAECWNWGANVWPSQHAIIAYRIVKGETDAE